MTEPVEPFGTETTPGTPAPPAAGIGASTPHPPAPEPPADEPQPARDEPAAAPRDDDEHQAATDATAAPEPARHAPATTPPAIPDGQPFWLREAFELLHDRVRHLEESLLARR